MYNKYGWWNEFVQTIAQCRVQSEVYMEQCWLYSLTAAGRKDLQFKSDEREEEKQQQGVIQLQSQSIFFHDIWSVKIYILLKI